MRASANASCYARAAWKRRNAHAPMRQGATVHGESPRTGECKGVSRGVQAPGIGPAKGVELMSAKEQQVERAELAGHPVCARAAFQRGLSYGRG